jgi:hypothetical protein
VAPLRQLINFNRHQMAVKSRTLDKFGDKIPSFSGRWDHKFRLRNSRYTGKDLCRLPPLKLRQPLFDKGGYALASIISRDDSSEFGLLDSQPVVDRSVETAMNCVQRQ